MTTIPQVARAMREILTTTADDAARTTRFVQRTSPLSGATFSQPLVCGFLGNPQATLEALTQTAAACAEIFCGWLILPTCALPAADVAVEKVWAPSLSKIKYGVK